MNIETRKTATRSLRYASKALVIHGGVKCPVTLVPTEPIFKFQIQKNQNLPLTGSKMTLKTMAQISSMLSNLSATSCSITSWVVTEVGSTTLFPQDQVLGPQADGSLILETATNVQTMVLNFQLQLTINGVSENPLPLVFQVTLGCLDFTKFYQVKTTHPWFWKNDVSGVTMVVPASPDVITTKTFFMADVYEMVSEFPGCTPASFISFSDSAGATPTTPDDSVGFEVNPVALASNPKVVLKFRGVPPSLIFRNNLETTARKILFQVCADQPTLAQPSLTVSQLDSEQKSVDLAPMVTVSAANNPAMAHCAVKKYEIKNFVTVTPGIFEQAFITFAQNSLVTSQGIVGEYKFDIVVTLLNS